MKKHVFFRFFILKYLFYKFLLMLVKKDEVWQQFTKIDVGGTTRAKCNMCCERDVVLAGTALLDNGHELRDAAITSWRRQSTKIIIFI